MPDALLNSHTCLLTGATGFLGGHCLKALSSGGEAPFVLNRSNPFFPEKGIRTICHLAALVAYRLEDSRELYEGNVAMTRELVQHYPDARFVFSSSASVYGNGSAVFNECSAPCDVRPYGLSKIWAEQWVKSLPDHAIIRFSSLYGPDMKEITLIPRFVNQALNTGKIEVWGDGSRKQNYLHVQDAVGLLIKTIESKQTGVFLGVGNGEWTNLQIARIIAEYTGASIVLKGEDPAHSVAYENQFTKNTLQWEPEISIEQGIHQYIEWKRKQSL